MTTTTPSTESPAQTVENLRKKYLDMAKTLGVDETITALHNEIGSMEPHIYDEGYKMSRLELVQQLRELSREIWTMKFKS